MGKDFFATGLQKKMEKIGEDFLRLSISKHSDFYGAVWITQNALFFTGICGRTESSAPTWCGAQICAVGADDSVGPLGSCDFAAEFRKNGAFCRADVGIGPYTGCIILHCPVKISFFDILQTYTRFSSSTSRTSGMLLNAHGTMSASR